MKPAHHVAHGNKGSGASLGYDEFAKDIKKLKLSGNHIIIFIFPGSIQSYPVTKLH